jgi:ribosomal protein S6--L-glutamate ligase
VAGTAAELAAAVRGWADEPVVVQDFAAGDGWDHKFWVIGNRVFAGLRRPPGVTGGEGSGQSAERHGTTEAAGRPPRTKRTTRPVDVPRPASSDPAGKGTVELPLESVAPGWAGLVLRTGKAFGLDIYGVDVLATPDGPVVVDVNAFPGFRGVAEAPAALAEFTAAALD